MTIKVFPINDNILQIPIDEFKKNLEPKTPNVSIKFDVMEVEEDFDIDFRQLREDEITPEIRSAIEESKKLPESAWSNLTAKNS